MPLKKELKKVMVIGSGPITIGQAAEFDYAGTQACKALQEEGIKVILVNSNPATIMTDETTADRVYVEPLTVEIIEKIIAKERPDALLPTLGGQTGLNMAVKLAEEGILEKYNVKLIGTEIETIKKSEDRELFKRAMESIDEPVAESIIAVTVQEALDFSEKIGFPLIIRPAFTLGGSGGGIANNREELAIIADRGISYSIVGQILVERSLLGYKEIEYEVMRDSNDNCITICNMENMDPVGVHTGDSIVVVPTQTLTDREHQMLRSAAIKIIRELKIEGGCNIQYALDPVSMKYFIIEVNPRVSRSSALASKAAGYPIARIAAKIAIGYTLDEIKNPITGNTTACFEPTLDYIVCKLPRWPFDKFFRADRGLNTQMKATGEVMTIDRSFEAALMKAIRSLEIKSIGLYLKSTRKLSHEELMDMIINPNDMRLWAIAEALRRRVTIEEIVEKTGINIWFITKVNSIVEMEKTLINKRAFLDVATIKKAKEMGYSDREIAKLAYKTEAFVKKTRMQNNIIPSCKVVDTCAAEFESATAYYYSAYDNEDEVEVSDKKKIIVLGSGSIRIGQGIEFDYCAVHAAQAVKNNGIEAIIINNNPETVSTDFDSSDKLYFEPIYYEDVMNIIEKEKPEGLIVQFGGQTALNTAKVLSKIGVKILGTNFEAIDVAEDRKKFDKLLSELNIKRPEGVSAGSHEEALTKVLELGFPVLVRPSYVIGGQSMRIVYNIEGLKDYLKDATNIAEDEPLLMDKYIEGMEAEVDAVCDGEHVFIPGIMEHIERTGIHSGDSMSIFPSKNISLAEKRKIIEVTEKIAIALKIKGLINIQYAVSKGEIYVIEANPRASRTIPIISKVTGIPMVELATKVVLGYTLKELGYTENFKEVKGIYSVKAPVFSFEKIPNLDNVLGPEMKSTGEVMGIDNEYLPALYKSFEGAGHKIIDSGSIIFAVPEYEIFNWSRSIERFKTLGFDVTVEYTDRFNMTSREEVIKMKAEIISKKYKLIISTDTRMYDIRRAAIEGRISGFNTPDTVTAYLDCVEYKLSGKTVEVKALQDFKREFKTING